MILQFWPGNALSLSNLVFKVLVILKSINPTPARFCVWLLEEPVENCWPLNYEMEDYMNSACQQFSLPWKCLLQFCYFILLYSVVLTLTTSFCLEIDFYCTFLYKILFLFYRIPEGDIRFRLVETFCLWLVFLDVVRDVTYERLKLYS